MMENEIRKCCICGNEFKISEIAKAYVKKGKAIYVCYECNRKIKELPGDISIID